MKANIVPQPRYTSPPGIETVATWQGRPFHVPCFDTESGRIKQFAIAEHREIKPAADPRIVFQCEIERLIALALGTAMNPGAYRHPVATMHIRGNSGRSAGRQAGLFIFPWPSCATSKTTSPWLSNTPVSRTSSRTVWKVYDKCLEREGQPTPFAPPSSHGRLWSSIATIACLVSATRSSDAVTAVAMCRPLAITFRVRVHGTVASGVIDSELRSSQTVLPSQAKFMR